MPRTVRNFWVELEVDGRKTVIGTGPRGKEGGINIRIYQRDNGGIVKAADIWGRADDKSISLEVATYSDQVNRSVVATKR